MYSLNNKYFFCGKYDKDILGKCFLYLEVTVCPGLRPPILPSARAGLELALVHSEI